MMTIREYKRAESLEEAWQLNQKKNNRVLGGMIWLKMEKLNVGTAIDLSGLGLDTVEETDEGENLRERVHDLKQLVKAYQLGWIKETRSEDQVWKNVTNRRLTAGMCRNLEKKRQIFRISERILGKTENNGTRTIGALLFCVICV